MSELELKSAEKSIQETVRDDCIISIKEETSGGIESIRKKNEQEENREKDTIVTKCVKDNDSVVINILDNIEPIERQTHGNQNEINVVHIDINEEIALQKSIELQAIRDSLTSKAIKKSIFKNDRKNKKTKTVVRVYFQRAPGEYGAMDYDPDGDSSRNAFVRLVFLLCALMLAVVVIFTIFAHYSKGMRKFMRSKFGFLVAICCSILLMLVGYAYCLLSVARDFPINVCLNFIGTVCYSYICGFVTTKYAPYIVLGAVGITFIISVFCLGLAFTSFDFTKFILLVAVAMIALALASVFCVILSLVLGIKLTLVRIIILFVLAVLQSILLVIELQMILGGKSIELGEEEYVYGSYMIFTSFINLFLDCLGLINQLGLLDLDDD